MQIARFDHSDLISFIRICGSAQAVQFSLEPTTFIWNDAFLLQPKKDLVFMAVIGEMIGSMEITLFHDESNPTVTDAVYLAEIPFSIDEHQGSQPISQAIYDVRKNRKQPLAEDQGNTLLLFANEEYRIIDMPSGNYLLTIVQKYAEDIALEFPEHASPELIVNTIQRMNMPVQLRLYFNPVESLDDSVARERWNWPDGINTPGMQVSWQTVYTFVQSGDQEELPHQSAIEQDGMITTLSELTSLLEKTPYADRETTVLGVEDDRDDDNIIIEAKTGDIDEHRNQSVFFIEVKHNEERQLQNAFMSMLDETARWPVLSLLCRNFYGDCLRRQNPNANWKETVEKAFGFSKSRVEHYYEHKKSF